MKTRTKVILWSAAVCLVAFLVWAANPSFGDFDLNQFATSSAGPNQVSIKTLARLTNVFGISGGTGFSLLGRDTAGTGNLLNLTDSNGAVIVQATLAGLTVNSGPAGIVSAGNIIAPNSALTNAAGAGASTLKFVGVADGVSITPTVSMDVCVQTNTQVSGTLTINNPTGTPITGQRLAFRIKCTNTQTLAYGNQYNGSTDSALPVSTTGSSKWDYLSFWWNESSSKWDLVGGRNFGF